MGFINKYNIHNVMARFTSFDDWSAWMQTVIKENGVGAITGPVMQEVLAELSDTAEYLVNTSGSSADGRALAAEGYAVGTQRGVPVEEGSPYYHNNAKYWAEVVESRATALGELTAEARQAIDDANAAVRAAAGAAHDATEAAGSALGAAALAEQNAEIASDAAAAATTAKGEAEDAAAAATAAGDYARGEIDGAKGDYESLDARFDHVDEISMYWQTVSTPSSDPDLVQEYDRVLAVAYQMITDMGAVTRAAQGATTTAEQAGRYADQMGDKADASSRAADEQTLRASAAADSAEQKASEAAAAASDCVGKTRQCVTATDNAVAAASNANQKAGLANDAATLANQKAQFAEEQGNYSKAQGDYAKGEIDGAKGDFESLDARFDHVDQISMYWQTVETPSSDPDLVQEYERVLAVAYQAIADMKAVMSGTSAAAADANQAADRALAAIADMQAVIDSSRAAVEACSRAAANADLKAANCDRVAEYSTQRGDYAQQQGFYAQQQGDYAKAKANEIENAKGDFATLKARLDYMQGLLEKAMYFETTENENENQ
jgi:hypothetical protein